MLGEVMRRGKRAPVPRMFVPGRDGAPADALVSLYYTSGSTGLPKGAMYTDKLWRRWWCAPFDWWRRVGMPPVSWSQLQAVDSSVAVGPWYFAVVCGWAHVHGTWRAHCHQACTGRAGGSSGCSPGGTLEYTVSRECTFLIGASRGVSVTRARRLSKTSGMGMCPSVASIQLGFLPLNHILGRNAVLMCMRAGGYITFVRLAGCLHTATTRPLRACPHAMTLHGCIPGCEVCGQCLLRTHAADAWQ